MAHRKRRRRHKNSGDKHSATQAIVLITAILQLITVLLQLFKELKH